MKFVDLNFENKKAATSTLEKFSLIEETGQYLLGQNLNDFESKFSFDQNKKNCIGVKNATDALYLVFKLLDCTSKTVIVPQFGAYPTVMAAIQANAKNIIAAPVDENFCLDLSCVEIPKNSIIVPVNLFGNECNIDELDQIARSCESVIVEDCAQSTGIPSKNISTIAASIHSFYPTKPLGSRGDGGAILTNNDDLAQLSKKARFYGINQNIIDSWGFNSRMDEWQSAFLTEKITYYRDMNAARRKNALFFNDSLTTHPKQTKNCVFHQYVTLWKNRDKIQEILKNYGIPTIIHYPKMLCDMPFLKDKVQFLDCKRISDHILSLPVGPHLLDKDIELISDVLRILNDQTIDFQDL